MVESVKLIPREIREMHFPEARFLNREEQAKYEEACKGFGEKARKSLDVSLQGSNLWKVLLLNQIGIRTASIQELYSAVENGLPLRGFYEDTPAVVLRSAGDTHAPNNALAKNLAGLIKKKDFPHAVIIEWLVLEEDNDSQYGFSFRDGERIKIIEAPDFDNKNHGRRFKRINPDYTIEFDDNGERILCTRDNGLSRLYLYRDLDAASNDEDLADSDGCGRVVVVSGEASEKNLEQYVLQLKQEADKQKAEIDARFKKAQAVLLSKQSM